MLIFVEVGCNVLTSTHSSPNDNSTIHQTSATTDENEDESSDASYPDNSNSDKQISIIADNNETESSNIPYEIVGEKLSEQNYDFEKLEFFYPQLFGENRDFSDVNELIRSYILNLPGFSKDEESDQSLITIYNDFKIAYGDDEIISIVFANSFSRKKSAHPMNSCITINIDLETVSLIKLSDVYEIDSYFLSILRENFNEQLSRRMGEERTELAATLFDICDDNEWLKRLNECDDLVKVGIYSYFTKSGVAISCRIPYSLGDHFETIIPYELLEKNEKNPEFFSRFRN